MLSLAHHRELIWNGAARTGTNAIWDSSVISGWPLISVFKKAYSFKFNKIQLIIIVPMNHAFLTASPRVHCIIYDRVNVILLFSRSFIVLGFTCSSVSTLT